MSSGDLHQLDAGHLLLDGETPAKNVVDKLADTLTGRKGKKR